MSRTPVLISLYVCPRPRVPRYLSRYKILAPAAVDKAKEPKDAAAAILDSTGLDADMYRLGHTKARFTLFSSPDRSISVWPRPTTQRGFKCDRRCSTIEILDS